MPDFGPAQIRLDRLRQYRNPRELDRSLRTVIEPLFKQQVERPYRQLGNIVEIWAALLPTELLRFTRLESFSRGVLNVSAASSAHLYELDRLLRSGLEQQLRQQFTGGTLRRVRLSVGHWQQADDL